MSRDETGKNIVVCLLMAAVAGVILWLVMPSIKQAMNDSYQREDQSYMKTDPPPVGVQAGINWNVRHWNDHQKIAAVIGALIVIAIVAFALHNYAGHTKYKRALEAENSQLRLRNAALRGELPKPPNG